jgi:DNA replication protein DnaC
VLFLAILYPARYWYFTKMYLQYSKFPMQFRLSQWKRPPETKQLKKEDINTVLSFIANASKQDGNHLLIFGDRRSDKSALAIGIGTELSIKRCPSSYYTAMKLFNLFSLSEQEIIETDDYNVWSWRTSSLLIIDDIDPGRPMQKTVLSAQDMLNAIDSRGNTSNRDCLKDKNVVWVLGDEAPMIAGSWQKLLLKDIGVEEDKISAVGLGRL